MKKYFVALLTILSITLATVIGYAMAKGVFYGFEGESWFDKVGVTGGQQTGNPGYIALQANDGGDTVYTYYLWVDNTGDLKIASYPVISTYTSFPTGDWRNSGMGGAVVGGQS